MPALPTCVSGCTGSAGSCDTGESPSLNWGLMEICPNHNSRKILLGDVDRYDTTAKKRGWGPIKNAVTISGSEMRFGLQGG